MRMRHHVKHKTWPEQWAYIPNYYPCSCVWSWRHSKETFHHLWSIKYNLIGQIFQRCGQNWVKTILALSKSSNTMTASLFAKIRTGQCTDIDPLIHDSVIFMLRHTLFWFWINGPWTCPSCFETPVRNWWVIYKVFFIPLQYLATVEV